MSAWDSYRPPERAAGPVSPEERAFIAYRAEQRRQTAAILAGKRRNGSVAKAVARTVLAEHATRERLAQPAERAKLFLQSRHYVVFAAPLAGGPAGHWKIGGRNGFATTAEMIALAERLGFTIEGNDHV
ncbi:hypothetical protein [Sphingomonas morindae]|uniref:Uncharacterized protein n=1 Tax=Sphingomonas morindae TaxID=1541170 RepID=A0ABY4X3Y6_9SPHN|nr:hypothetical protein [Sphingomonas morindae]USI71633.1 hypothetical protein LHA26_09820 [Sphingomonas morindae]